MASAIIQTLGLSNNGLSYVVLYNFLPFFIDGKNIEIQNIKLFSAFIL